MEKGNVNDEDDLINGRILGLMRGSFVGCALIEKYGNDKIGMVKPWKMSYGAVTLDLETFSYPCKLNTGICENLTLFIADLIKKDIINILISKYDLDCFFADTKVKKLAIAIYKLSIRIYIILTENNYYNFKIYSLKIRINNMRKILNEPDTKEETIKDNIKLLYNAIESIDLNS